MDEGRRPVLGRKARSVQQGAGGDRQGLVPPLCTCILRWAISACGFDHIAMTAGDSRSEGGTLGQLSAQVWADDTSRRGSMKCEEVTD
jgi:hypothetical protein